MNHSEIAYWITITHLKGWATEKINRLVIKIVHTNSMELSTFFALEKEWKSSFDLSDEDILDLKNALKELPNNSFLSEQLLSQGFEILPLNSPLYPKSIKSELKIKYSPTILYTKGNIELFDKQSFTILGTNKTDTNSLEIADKICQKLATQKVLVSGFSKGIEQHSLDKIISYHGQSILVLPQGIMSYNIKPYYKNLTQGDILFVSVFFPKEPFSSILSENRQPIIESLSNEIFLANYSDNTGNWQLSFESLRKNKPVYIRKPITSEKNGFASLIQNGAKPLDF